MLFQTKWLDCIKKRKYLHFDLCEVPNDCKKKSFVLMIDYCDPDEFHLFLPSHYAASSLQRPRTPVSVATEPSPPPSTESSLSETVNENVSEGQWLLSRSEGQVVAGLQMNEGERWI